MLEDGTYDGLIIDARPVEGAEAPVLSVEIALSTGPHKGEVVHVRGRFPGRSDLDLLAAPVTLTVVDGEPTVALDD